MAAIVLLLIQIFGPILADAFSRWLKKRLEDKAKTIIPQVGARSGGNAVALLQSVHDDLPLWAVRKRFLVRRMIAHIDPEKDLPEALPPHAVAELRDTDARQAEEGGE